MTSSSEDSLVKFACNVSFLTISDFSLLLCSATEFDMAYDELVYFYRFLLTNRFISCFLKESLMSAFEPASFYGDRLRREMF